MKFTFSQMRTGFLLLAAITIFGIVQDVHAVSPKTKTTFLQIESGFKTIPDSIQTSGPAKRSVFDESVISTIILYFLSRNLYNV
jgi:hypothetical protein